MVTGGPARPVLPPGERPIVLYAGAHMVGFIRRLFRRQPASIPALVRERFGRIATAPQREKRRIGPLVARELGYDPGEIDRLPQAVTESFAGVGNPHAVGEVRPGETVLDLGSGAGLDSILAARKVGPGGRVVGIDFTPEMIAKARRNVQAVGLSNVAFHHAPVEALPLADNTADVAICNGLFNLCPDKPKALAEVFRVLKPGGRFLIADILLEDQVTPEVVAHKGAWSDWISGAVGGRSFLQMLAGAGFADARFHGWTGFRTSSYTQGAHLTARKPSPEGR